MPCSTCDGYEFVPDPADPDGEKIDCPDCRAIDERPLVWCPVHSDRVQMDGSCRKCRVEAANAEDTITLRSRAAAAVVTAKTVRDRQIARDLVVRARLAAEEAA